MNIPEQIETEAVYGIQPILQTLLSGRRTFLKFYHSRKQLTPEVKQIFRLLREKKIAVQEVSKERLFQICQSTDHQGVVLEATPFSYIPFYDFRNRLASFEQFTGLILDQIQDPQNLGAILRTAHCAGVQFVILPEKGSAHVTPSVLKASAGAAEHLHVFLTGNFGSLIRLFEQNQIKIFGSEADAPSPYFEVQFPKKVVFVVGSEAVGIRPAIRKLCNEMVKIPMEGTISSLNVSVATGILLFENLRQQLSNRKN